MRFVTIGRGQDGPHLGLLCGPDTVLDLSAASDHDPQLSSMLALIDGGADAFAAAQTLAQRATGQENALDKHLYRLSDIQLQAPIPVPRKNVYCMGLNYRSHIEQNAAALGIPVEVPELPLFFSKPVTSVIGPEEGIVCDERLTAKLDYEVELAVVIGRRGTWIPEEEALDYVVGYTIVNDVSARDLQWRASQFLYGKGQDTYCPMGPCVVTRDEFERVEDPVLRLRVNGEVRQEEAALNMLFAPAAVISALSRGITLDAGDVVSLGTPGGCGYQLSPPRFLQVGDVVECEIDGIGVLANRVIRPGVRV